MVIVACHQEGDAEWANTSRFCRDTWSCQARVHSWGQRELNDACQRTCELLHDGSGLSAELCDWDVFLEVPVVCLQNM